MRGDPNTFELMITLIAKCVHTFLTDLSFYPVRNLKSAVPTILQGIENHFLIKIVLEKSDI
jgi:hypothetical protein